MNLYLRFSFLLFFSCVFLNSFGQSSKIKYGKIDTNDLVKLKGAFDSTANAVIMSNVAATSFTYNGSFTLMLKRHIRIKILTEKGFDEANRTISFMEEVAFKM